MSSVDLAIVGAGPAGLSAALAAASCGLRPVVIDENPTPGGQIYRQLPADFRVERAGGPRAHVPKGPKAASQSLSGRYRLEAGYYGLGAVRSPNPRAGQRGSAESLQCKALVLSTGGYDRAVPFPGWTLPGVMTLGRGADAGKEPEDAAGEEDSAVGVRAVSDAGGVAAH